MLLYSKILIKMWKFELQKSEKHISLSFRGLTNTSEIQDPMTTTPDSPDISLNILDTLWPIPPRVPILLFRTMNLVYWNLWSSLFLSIVVEFWEMQLTSTLKLTQHLFYLWWSWQFVIIPSKEEGIFYIYTRCKYLKHSDCHAVLVDVITSTVCL